MNSLSDDATVIRLPTRIILMSAESIDLRGVCQWPIEVHLFDS
jgi:hypothetical protein